MGRLSLCGVVCEAGRYLIARRNPGGSQGGKWEFPGGKQEDGETPEQSLAREFLEELAVEAVVGRQLYVGAFSNGVKDYRLEAWEVRLPAHPKFHLSEHQELRWVAPSDLASFDLSDSDRQVALALVQAPVEPSSESR